MSSNDPTILRPGGTPPPIEPETPAPDLPVVDSNRQAAAESAHAGEAYTVCPTCDRLCRIFVLIDNKCDGCRVEAERTEVAAFERGWPEVNQRRMTMLVESDATQLPDRDAEVRESFVAWRQALRDITDHGSPDEAWSQLDTLQDSRPAG